jgi:hypothetical protein
VSREPPPVPNALEPSTVIRPSFVLLPSRLRFR